MKHRIIVGLTCAALTIIALPLAAAAPDAAAVYKSKCAMCHGPDGSSQTPAGKTMKSPDLRSPEVQKLSDKELTTVINDGKGKMQPYKAKLTPAEISALVQFVRTFKK